MMLNTSGTFHDIYLYSEPWNFTTEKVVIKILILGLFVTIENHQKCIIGIATLLYSNDYNSKRRALPTVFENHRKSLIQQLCLQKIIKNLASF